MNKVTFWVVILLGLASYVAFDVSSIFNKLDVEGKVAKTAELPIALELNMRDSYDSEPMLPPVIKNKPKKKSTKKNNKKNPKRSPLSKAQGKVGDYVITLFSTSNKSGFWQALIKLEKSGEQATMKTVEITAPIETYKVTSIKHNSMTMSDGNQTLSFLLFN